LPSAKPAKAEYRRHLPHLQKEDKPHFITFITFITFTRWVLPEPIRGLVLKHCLHGHRIKLQVHGVVIMPDHVHMIFTPLKDGQGNPYGLAEIMNGIKGASAHSINKALNRKGRVWQSESFDHVLRSDESIHSKVQYICENPVRKSLVESMDNYPWLWREWVEGEVHVAQVSPAAQKSAWTAEGGCPTFFRLGRAGIPRGNFLECLECKKNSDKGIENSPTFPNRLPVLS
jgi:REP element-mobilizing transposase RayT